MTVSVILVFWSCGPIEGSYLSLAPQISKHEYLLFKNGDVYGIVDTPPPIPPSIVHLGSYRFEGRSGWVWQLRGSERRITCKPSLLFMRFSWDDGNSLAATEPFRWRDPYFWKTRRVLDNEDVRAVLSSQNTNGAIRSVDK